VTGIAELLLLAELIELEELDDATELDELELLELLDVPEEEELELATLDALDEVTVGELEPPPPPQAESISAHTIGASESDRLNSVGCMNIVSLSPNKSQRREDPVFESNHLCPSFCANF
jgi:hypothetical protein